MKKILLGSSALIAAGFFAYTASAEVEFKLTGSVSGNAAYGSVNTDIKDTDVVNGKTTLINTKDQVFRDQGGQENIKFSVWTGGSLEGELSTVSASGITYKGHFRIFDGGDGRADIYVSAGGSFGTVFIGDRNFSSEIMKVGGFNYDVDSTGGYSDLTEDDGYSPKTPHHYNFGDDGLSLTPFYVEPVGDSDLASGTVNRLMYISPNLLGSDNDTGLHVGGYVALSDDQTSNYDHEWTSDTKLSDKMVYGVGLSYETALSETSDLVVDVSLQIDESSNFEVGDYGDYYVDASKNTVFYRVGAKYTLGDWAIKSFWGYKEQDLGVVSWADAGINGGMLYKLTRGTSHTFDVGAEYTMGAFTYGLDVAYAKGNIDAYKGIASTPAAGGVPAVRASLKEMDDSDTSTYLGVGAGVSIELLDGVTFNALTATYVHGVYTAQDGSALDILGVAGESMDYELNFVQVKTGLEVSF